MGNGTTEICAAHLLFVLLLQLQSIEAQIDFALQYAGAVMGVCRQDHFKHSITLRVNPFHESKETEMLKESTELCVLALF